MSVLLDTETVIQSLLSLTSVITIVFVAVTSVLVSALTVLVQPKKWYNGGP